MLTAFENRKPKPFNCLISDFARASNQRATAKLEPKIGIKAPL